ncbi:MAG: hypothetical protein PHQ28_06700 [Mycobacterium sp.]|nr:hypothetical protein [Mycobacterium sp.]
MNQHRHHRDRRRQAPGLPGAWGQRVAGHGGDVVDLMAGEAGQRQQVSPAVWQGVDVGGL